MQLTKEQKEKLIQKVEELSTSSFWEAEEQAVFDWVENGIVWQLQVRITRDEDDFMELNNEQ